MGAAAAMAWTSPGSRAARPTGAASDLGYAAAGERDHRGATRQRLRADQPVGLVPDRGHERGRCRPHEADRSGSRGARHTRLAARGGDAPIVEVLVVLIGPASTSGIPASRAASMARWGASRARAGPTRRLGPSAPRLPRVEVDAVRHDVGLVVGPKDPPLPGHEAATAANSPRPLPSPRVSPSIADSSHGVGGVCSEVSMGRHDERAHRDGKVVEGMVVHDVERVAPRAGQRHQQAQIGVVGSHEALDRSPSTRPRRRCRPGFSPPRAARAPGRRRPNRRRRRA